MLLILYIEMFLLIIFHGSLNEHCQKNFVVFIFVTCDSMMCVLCANTHCTQFLFCECRSTHKLRNNFSINILWYCCLLLCKIGGRAKPIYKGKMIKISLKWQCFLPTKQYSFTSHLIPMLYHVIIIPYTC